MRRTGRRFFAVAFGTEAERLGFAEHTGTWREDVIADAVDAEAKRRRR